MSRTAWPNYFFSLNIPYLTIQIYQEHMDLFADRRKHKRYTLGRQGVFAGFRPNMGEIIDISIGGILFHYLEFAKDPKEKGDFIICSEDGCCLDGFPCRVISDKLLANESALSQIVTRQQRVMFEQLTDEQQGLLCDFIDSHRN